MKNRYTNSDVFNSYVEIAASSGLVSLAADSEDSKRILDKNPRADSLTQERIAELYNLKINMPKDMEYKENIMERAHPEPVVLTESYDRLNSLIENENERKAIMTRIVNKKTNGLLTQHKYAHDELVRSIVRIANDMDNRDQEDLRSLADECLELINKQASDGVGDSVKNFFFGSDWR